MRLAISLLLLLCAPFAHATLESAITSTQSSNLKGYWKCNETSGTSLADSSGNSNTLTLTGTAGTDYSLNQTGFEGVSIRFFGISGYASRTDSVIGSPGDFTLVALVKGASQTASGVISFGKSTDNDTQIRMGAAASSTSTISFTRNDANSQTSSLTSGVAFDSSWHLISYRRNGSAFSAWVDGVSTGGETVTMSGITPDRTAVGALLRATASTFYTGYIQHVAVWNSALSNAEIAALFTSMSGTQLTVTAPASYQVIQRTGTAASITIAGAYTGSPTAIEASWNGAAYSTIVASPSGGTYSGTLSNQPQGQGTLTVRWTNDTSVNATKTYVGIGDVFVIGPAQSQGSGRGTSNQSYSHATFKAAMFGNDNTWKELVDPSDSSTAQVDTVSSDTIAAGSVWPLVATIVMAQTNAPVAFVQCSKGTTFITAWSPASDHLDRTTLYGSWNYRASLTGARFHLMWQGEGDITNGTSQASYNASYDSVINAIVADRGVKVMTPVSLEHLNEASEPNATQARQAAINAALSEAVKDNVSAVAGPDLFGVVPDNADGVHINGTSQLQACADRWAAEILGQLSGVTKTGMF